MKLGEYETNNIYNEDCYEAIKKIPDHSIDLIMTDPPYLIEDTKAGGHNDFSANGKKTIQKMNDQLEEGILTESIDTKILDDFMRIMKIPNIYIWCNHKQIPMYLDYFVTQKGCAFDIIIWNKPNAMPLFNNKYLTDKEYCLYFRRGGYCNPENYEEAKTVYCQPINVGDKKLFKHPTIKPMNIVSTLIKNSTKQGQIVADFFIGSGTTCVAAKNLEREYIGFELDKNWFNIAKNRLDNIDSKGQMSLFTI